MNNITIRLNNLIVFIAPVTFFLVALFFPFYNFDSLVYIAAAYDFLVNDISKSQELLVYELNNFFPTDIRSLYFDSAYSGVILKDIDALNEQLNLYNFRVGYIYLSIILHKLFDIPIIYALHTIQALSSFLVVFLALLLSKKVNNKSPFFTLIFLISIDIVSLVRLETPDMLCSALVLVAFYLYKLDKKNISSLIICFLPIFRTDLIVLCFIYFIFNYKNIVNWLFFLFSCFLYIFLNYYFETYGHLKTLEFTFFALSSEKPFPSKISLDLNYKDYLILYLESTYLFIRSFGFIVIGSLLILFSNRFNDLYFKSALISILFIVIHFLLFPSDNPRFYLWAFTCIFISFIAIFFNQKTKVI